MKSSEVSRAVREVPPAHYVLKIESFSKIVEENIEKLESDDFVADDYKWRLHVYPSGRNETNGTGYISLYLAIEDTDELPHGWKLNVCFNFFIYNHLEDNYLTIQDAGSKVRRFHALKTEWGFSQLISLEEFNDTSNGYLFQDSCVFGAEIFVIRDSAKGECITLIKEPTDKIFTWRIDNFSSITATHLFSSDFKIENQNWNVKLFPKGRGNAEGEWLSVYLYLDNPLATPKHKLYARYKWRLKDQVLNKHFGREGSQWFCSPNDNWGYKKFKKLSDLKDSRNGFVVNDTLIIEVEFMVISAVKKLS